MSGNERYAVSGSRSTHDIGDGLICVWELSTSAVEKMLARLSRAGDALVLDSTLTALSFSVGPDVTWLDGTELPDGVPPTLEDGWNVLDSAQVKALGYPFGQVATGAVKTQLFVFPDGDDGPFCQLLGEIGADNGDGAEIGTAFLDAQTLQWFRDELSEDVNLITS